MSKVKTICDNMGALFGIHAPKPTHKAGVPEDYFWDEMPENTNPNLKYNGYYHFENSSESIRDIAAAGNANVGKIDIDGENDYAQFKIMCESGLYVLVMIRHIFFDSSQPDYIRKDWQERWNAVKKKIEPYYDSVIGFYVDEPAWNGISQQAFHLASKTVRDDYPDKKMMVMLAYIPTMDITFVTKLITGAKVKSIREYCKYCTDICCDFYRNWDKEKVLKDIRHLTKKVYIEGQNIWLSPKGFYVNNYRKNINWFFENRRRKVGEEIVDWIKGCYEISVADERITGFFTFVYGDENTTKAYDAGLKMFYDKNNEYYDPEITQLYSQIGKAIIKNK